MTEVARIAIVDDDRAIRWVLERALAQPDLEVQSFERADAALESIERNPPDVLLTDIRMPGLDGLDLMAKVRQMHPDLPVIVMTAHSDLDSAVASYQGGAFEYLPKPFDLTELLNIVGRAMAEPKRPGVLSKISGVINRRLDASVERRMERKASKADKKAHKKDSTEDQWSTSTPSSLTRSVVSCGACGALNNSGTPYCTSCGEFLT